VPASTSARCGCVRPGRARWVILGWRGGDCLAVAGTSNAVFVSYASEDAEAAQRICDGLRAAGIEVWFDKSELRGGEAWDRQIRERVHDCRLFVAVISAHTESRDEGYFRREWRLAVERAGDMADKRTFVLPVVIDDTRERGAAVPDKFHDVQWTRLPAGETTTAFVTHVAELSAQAPAATAAAEIRGDVTARSQPAPRRSRWVAIVAIAAAVGLSLVLGYVGVVRFDLSKRSTVTSNTAPEKSIAVLPFVDMSEKHDQEYFADGIADEILDLLQKIPDLKVIGRTSSFQFRQRSADLRTIGSTLGAAYLLEGSVRRTGDRVRVTAQLIDANDGSHRWSESYDRTVSDVIPAQEELASSLAHALHVEIAAIGDLRNGTPVKNAEAYDSYLRGVYELEKLDREGFEHAAAHFRHAIDLEPSFVPALEELARTLSYQADFSYLPAQAGWEQARATAKTVLRINENSAVAHAVLGGINTQYDWDWSAAEHELSTAIALAPSNSYVRWLSASLHMSVGKWSEAARDVDAARATDPLDPAEHVVACWLYERTGRTADAVQSCRRAVEIAPTYAYAHFFVGVALLADGKPEEALLEFRREPDETSNLAGLAMAYHATGRDGDSDAAIGRLRGLGDHGWYLGLAYALAARGEKDDAFHWLDKAWQEKDPALFMCRDDPLLKSLTSDPRYKTFLRKMNLPE